MRILALVVLVFFPLCNSAENFYSDDTFQSYVGDKRARRIGDVVTLLVIESSEAEANREGQVDKNLDVSGGFNKAQQDSDSNKSRTENAGINFGLNASGSESTQRSGKLNAQITTEVKKIDELGKLYVRGKQKIVVNGEEQTIKISGWLRPQDVSPDNTALSIRLTDAKIQYTGDAADRPGVIRRIGRWFKRLW